MGDEEKCFRPPQKIDRATLVLLNGEQLKNYIFTFFCCVIILIAVLGNLLVILSVLFNRQLRKIKTHFFVVSLATADLLVALVVMPFGAIELAIGGWPFGQTFCLIRTSFDVMFTTASIMHLCCIALDRYYAICCKPLVYQNKMTPLRLVWMLGACWVLPSMISFIPIMNGWNAIGIEWLIAEREANSTQCVFVVNQVYAVTCSSVAFYIPFVLMTVAYQRIYVTARAHARHIRSLQRIGSNENGTNYEADDSSTSAAYQESVNNGGKANTAKPIGQQQHHASSRVMIETKAAKTLAFIMGCFCLSWAPFFISNVIDPFIDYSIPSAVWSTCLWLGYINSAINPFLYAFLNRTFRRAFLTILCCWKNAQHRAIFRTSACRPTTNETLSTQRMRYSMLRGHRYSEDCPSETRRCEADIVSETLPV
uniref:5-hydroxytryptamine receptor 4 n=1 Tax=Eptatretus burgeri TaxID=7764 RepID=A0A8C4X234_EPTBU